MRIHRLLLQDFRGVSRREVHLPDSGVVVLAGANEVGKSSLVEALDLLLHERASSTKASVRAVQPVGSDVGSVVEAELTLGPVRLVYRKQWNRGTATHLDLMTPVREQLTGRPAHERMVALLAEHLDVDLYQAQRVLQAGRIGEKWTAASSLTAALDDAAGRAVAQESGEDLVAAIEQEYRTLFTATGRPTGAWRELQQQHRGAVSAAESAREALSEIDSRVADHEAVRGQLAARTADVEAASDALASLRVRRTTMLDVATTLNQAEADLAAAVQQRDEADRAWRERTAVAARVEELTQQLARTDIVRAGLRADLAPAEAECERLATVVTRTHEQSVAADEAATLAQLEADREADLAEWRELQAVLAAVDAAESAVADSGAALELLPIGPVQETAVENAQRGVELAVAAARTAAPRLEVALESAAVQLLLDGRIVTGLNSHAVTEELTLDLPGVARISITPGAGAGDLGQRVRRARAELAALLDRLGVDDLAAAREQAARHRAVSAEHDRARARLTEITGRRSRQSLVDRGAQLRVTIGSGAVAPAPANTSDHPDDVPADPRAAARTAARRALQVRSAWRAAAGERDVAAEQVHRLRRELAGSDATFAAATEHRMLAAGTLAHLRADTVDAELSGRLLQTQQVVDTCRAAAALVRAEYAARSEPGLPEAIRAAEATLAQRIRELAAAEKALLTLSTELEIIGAEGRQERLDRAESELLVLSQQLASTTARADAVTLLREVVHRHRDQARSRYVAPFRQALVRLGRRWLGPSFDVTVGEDLQVLTRSLHGTTVAVTMVSTGAAEQLAVLIRLATASLVGGDDGVPVVLDDALGFTDPDRLAQLGPAFAGLQDSQILLLTCDPDRYRLIPGATVLTLDRETVTVAPARPAAEPAAAASPARARRRRPPERIELSLFDSDELADDRQLPLLLNPVRAGTAEQSA